MKKLFMTLVAAVIAVSASAQVYIGGNAGIASTKIGDQDSKTTYKVLPEIGYKINQDWAIGTVIGWGKGDPVTIEDADKCVGTFEVAPYVRYTAVRTKMVDFFIDGGFSYKHYNDLANEWTVGLKPGVALNLNKTVSIVAHAGFVGYKTINATYDGAKSSNAWGVDLDGNNLSLGVLLNF